MIILPRPLLNSFWRHLLHFVRKYENVGSTPVVAMTTKKCFRCVTFLRPPVVRVCVGGDSFMPLLLYLMLFVALVQHYTELMSLFIHICYLQINQGESQKIIVGYTNESRRCARHANGSVSLCAELNIIASVLTSIPLFAT
jgi:hypothetical protein